ncbi:hypothetical protein DMC47_14875 [Nostoc sp. 3335mG]|nr:hypothetical protein DMC47_14875 [Nostoc sp. 3335mG]
MFIGADLWPARNAQPAFRNTMWLDALRERPGGRAYGSIALFAPHFNYSWPGDARTPRYSNFDRDPGDVARFYDGERRLFAGDSAGRGAGWPGVASLSPTKGLMPTLPFTTSFNTGHGRVEARGGRITGGPWYDMSRQDALPTWQIAFEYDFDHPFNGGSSLVVQPQAGGGRATVPLYALRLPPSVTVTAVTRGGSGHALRIGRSTRRLPAGPDWQRTRWCVRPGPGETRVSVVIDRAARTAINIGQLSIDPGCRD